MINSLLNSFQRITSKGGYIPEIDGLRFLAIFPVVLMHANTNYNRVFSANHQIESPFFNMLINQGGKGVWIFFAISGFILSYAFAKHFWLNGESYSSLNLKQYFYRRLTRLEPPFIISTVALYIIMSFAIYGDFYNLLPNFFATLAYMHNIIYGEWSPINPVTWSLEVEVQFYILAPFVCAAIFALKESIRTVLLVLLIVAVPFVIYQPDSVFITNQHLTRTLPVYFHHFLVGILFCSFYTGSLWSKIKGDDVRWDYVGLFSICLIFGIDLTKDNVITHYIFDIGLLNLLVAAFKGKFLKALFSNKYISTIGGMCYSIYLLHYAIIFVMMKITSSVTFENYLINYTFQVGVSVFIVTIVSALFFKYFEKPYMDRFWPLKFRNRIKNYWAK